MTSSEFQRKLGADLTEVLGGQYQFFKSRLELRANAPDGHNILILAGSTKYSPHISVDFYFGRSFASAKQVERRLGGDPSYYHIQQFSPNRKRMKALPYSGPYTWSIDINNPPATL